MTGTTAGGAANLDYVDVSSGALDYQAETCTISQGVVESNHTGYTGTGFVNGDNVVGSYVECTIVPGTPLTVRYANGTTADRPMTVSATGTTLTFAPTGAWTTWSTVSVALPPGTTTVRLTAATANGGPNLDRLTVG